MAKAQTNPINFDIDQQETYWPTKFSIQSDDTDIEFTRTICDKLLS